MRPIRCFLCGRRSLNLTRWSLSIAVAMLGMVGDALADPPYSVDPSLTDAAVLRYQFAEESAVSYRLNLDQTIVMSGRVLDGESQTTMGIQMDTTQTVQSVNEEGNGIVAQLIDDVAIELAVDEVEHPMGDLSELMNTLVITLQISPRGEVVDTQVDSASNAQLAEVLTMLDGPMGQMNLVLPEAEVEVGDTWEEEIPLTLNQGGMDLETTTMATYAFLGYADVEGTICAVVGSAIDFSISGTFEEMGMTTTADGTGTGSGYTYFDHNEGVLVYSTIELELDTAISAEGMELQQQINMTMTNTKL